MAGILDGHVHLDGGSVEIQGVKRLLRDAERVGEGKKSMAFSLTYRAADRTLTSEEVDKAHEKLVTKVSKATGAEMRG